MGDLNADGIGYGLTEITCFSFIQYLPRRRSRIDSNNDASVIFSKLLFSNVLCKDSFSSVLECKNPKICQSLCARIEKKFVSRFAPR
uniref:Uncharacterized protein n=1 Tax=Romanomermis culicivorax TaxID=13658 RepID=A0A915L2T5_ROMCU